MNSIIRSILRWFLPGKWALLGQTVEGGSKNYDSFTGIQWPLICFLLINKAIINDTSLCLSMG